MSKSCNYCWLYAGSSVLYLVDAQTWFVSNSRLHLSKVEETCGFVEWVPWFLSFERICHNFFPPFLHFLWHFCTTGLFSLETIILKVMTMSSVFILFHLNPHCIKKIAHIYRVGVSDQKLGLFKLANAAQSLSRHFQCSCTEHILDMQVLLKKFSAHKSILKLLNRETKSQTHIIPPPLVH